LSKYGLFYESAEDVLVTAPRHFAAHRARYGSFRDTGQLLLMAPLRTRGEMARWRFSPREKLQGSSPTVTHSSRTGSFGIGTSVSGSKSLGSELSRLSALRMEVERHFATGFARFSMDA
jgi:hypothetical protein